MDREIGRELRDSVVIQRYFFQDRRRVARVIAGARRKTTVRSLILDLAIGRRSNDGLYRALRGRLPVFRIGDCAAPRFLQQAILEGDRIGREFEARLRPADDAPRA